MLFWNILFVFLLVGLNAFFVSVEFAAVTSRRSHIELLAERGNAAAKIVKTWLENPAARDRLIAASQLGVTIASLALGAVGENTFQVLLQPLFLSLNLPPAYQVLTPLLTGLPLILSLIIVTSIHVVMGEQVPKVATLQNPEKVAMLVAQPMRLFSTVFKWFISLLDWITRQVLGWVGIEMVGEHTLMYTVEEIKHILSESEEGGVIEPPERKMLDAIFDLEDLLVRHVMIPRTEIVAVEADILLPEIISLISSSTYTKFPVYEDNLDQILGIVHVKDLLQAMQSEDSKNCTARSLVREAIYVSETLPVSKLLQKFQANRQHIAIVLDEYGGTAGLVALEDLLEEIVGEVSDPFDVVKPEIQTMPDGTILVDGLTLIEDVNNQLDLHLVDPNYDTIAGYMLGRLGHIPQAKESVDGDGVRLQAEVMDEMRIARVRLTRLDKSTGSKEPVL